MAAPLAPEEIVNRILLTVVKARSNAAESGTLEVTKTLDPRFYGTEDPLALFNVCTRMQTKGGEIDVHDAFNALSLAHRCESFVLVYFLLWAEDPPEALDYMRESLAHSSLA